MVEELQRPDRTKKFNVYLAGHIERTLARPELAELKKWYQERLANLGEMEENSSAITGTGGWNKELTEQGEVDRITSPFFNIVGSDIVVKNTDGSIRFRWHQAGIVNAASPIDLPSPEGMLEMNISGFVGALIDPDGKVLLTVAQEPYQETPKSAIARTPLQTSATKLQGLLEGRDELDPALATLLKKLGGDKAISEMFASGDIDIFPLGLADGNRMKSTNIGFGITIQDETLRESLTANGQNRWCTSDEVGALKRAGLTNSHTANAIDSTQFNLRK